MSRFNGVYAPLWRGESRTNGVEGHSEWVGGRTRSACARQRREFIKEGQ